MDLLTHLDSSQTNSSCLHLHLRLQPSLSAKPAKAAPKTISKMIFDMDLFKDKSTQNDYGARGAKKITLGKIQAGKSYVPSGLTAAQFDAKRKADKAKKDAGYKRNVAKAGVFEDYTAFYTKVRKSPPSTISSTN